MSQPVTYPTKPSDALDADGAFQIGGGEFKFGQQYTDSVIRSLFEVPVATVGNAMQLLRDHLLKLPLEALKGFEGLLPNVLEGAFETVGGAVDAILDNIIHQPLFLKFQEWTEFVIDLINRILHPFGKAGNFHTVEQALNELATTLAAPWQYLSNLQDWIQDLFQQKDSEIAALRAEMRAMRHRLDPTTTLHGKWDPCVTADGFDPPLVGILKPTGYGTLTSSAKAVAHYKESPSQDRNRVGMWVKSKTIGQTLLYFCSDNAMTNWCGLLLDNQPTGDDTVTLVTGSGPWSGIEPRAEFKTRLPNEMFWEIAYEPEDEDGVVSNTFYVFLGQELIVPLTWTDEGNAVLHGPDHRRWGVGINGLNHPTRRGWQVTDVTFSDWETGAPE